MKKLLLSFALAATVISLKAQTFSTLWYYDAVAAGLVNSSSTNSGLAYNPVTGNIYVANRGGEIYIVDPTAYAAGALKSTAFDLTNGILIRPQAGVNAMTEVNRFYKVKVTSKGVIYSIAMQTNGLIYIYKWLSEGDASPKKYLVQDAAIGNTSRVGDSFAIFEDDKGDADATNDEVILYTAGAVVTVTSGGVTTTVSTGQNLFVMKDDAKTDGTSAGPVFFKTVDMQSAKHSAAIMDIAKGSISVESANVVWVKSFQTGVLFRRLVLDFTAGVVSGSKTYSSPSANFTFGDLINENGTGYLLAGSSSGAGTGGLTLSLSSYATFGTEPASLSTVTTTLLPRATYTSSTGYGDFARVKNANGTMTVFFLVSKNGLAAYQSSVPLPVSLTSFTGSLVKGQSNLAWSTASESNNKGFDVLRSTDGQNFSPVGFVNSKGQNGNAATALAYSFVDRTAAAGVNYYQLKQIDNDGKSELFKDVVSVDVSLSGDAITVYPNPISTYVNVSTGGLDFKGFKYEIFDGNGKKVLSQKASSGEQQISVANLAPSVYFLKVSKDNVPQKTVKLVKE